MAPRRQGGACAGPCGHDTSLWVLSPMLAKSITEARGGTCHQGQWPRLCLPSWCSAQWAMDSAPWWQGWRVPRSYSVSSLSPRLA